MRKLIPRKVYDSNRNLYPWFIFLSLELIWHKSRIHHSKREFKYAKYLKLLPNVCWFGSLPLIIIFIDGRQQKWQRNQNVSQTKEGCAVTDCIPISYLEAQKLSKKASMYLSLEAIATAHIYRLWKGQNVQSLHCSAQRIPQSFGDMSF